MVTDFCYFLRSRRSHATQTRESITPEETHTQKLRIPTHSPQFERRFSEREQLPETEAAEEKNKIKSNLRF